MYTVIHGLDVIMEFKKTVKGTEHLSSTTVMLEQQSPMLLKGSADCTHCSLLNWEQFPESPRGIWESGDFISTLGDGESAQMTR